MAAPLGNNYWELRSKHGRDKLFSTPELMWEACVEYFQWVDLNNVEKEDYVGKDADRVLRQLQRPYSLSGLCVYLDCGVNYFNQFESALDLNTDLGKGYSLILTRIRGIIFSQQFDGATTGVFNANIIARSLGLTDRSDITSGNEIIQNPSINLGLLSNKVLEELEAAANKQKDG